MHNTKGALRACGLNAVANGFSVIPIDPTTKRPSYRLLPYLFEADGSPVMKTQVDKATGEIRTFHGRGWKPFQQRIATPREINCWVGAGAQLAAVGGAVSGGLLVIDFDRPGFFGRWYRACWRAGINVRALTIQRTGGGGWQVLLRCPNPGESQKLAWTCDPAEESGRSVAIETRGEGGYAVIAPSLHPSGNCYRWRRGDLSTVYDWPQDTVTAMLEIARSMNEVSEPEQRYAVVRGERRTDLPVNARVIDTFNQQVDIGDMLKRAGYTYVHGDRWHRPNHQKTSEPSVQVCEETNRSWHWSSNDQLSDGYWATPFKILLVCLHDNNMAHAVRAAAVEMGMERLSASRELGHVRAVGATATPTFTSRVARRAATDWLLAGNIKGL